ncbi:MAG: guanylate kinase [Chloroflexi bacterium]|nr:guanylate kinase [Chloroflexota bacterium]
MNEANHNSQPGPSTEFTPAQNVVKGNALKTGIAGGAKPLLILLSGPSGVGKDAVLARMKASDFPLKYIVTLTTRPRRPNEKANIDYHFISPEKFQELIDKNELLEWAEVYGNRYGVPKEAVKRALDHGQDVMLKVDIQGVANIRKIVPQAVTIFLTPSSMEELERRLRRRHTESAFDLARRLKVAEEEMKELVRFDYAVMNREGEIDRAVTDIKAIITAEKCRVKPREITL